MNHRHLLPEEFDLLLDDEVGFGVAPLRVHLEACTSCRAQFEEARQVATALEGLPTFAPSYALANKVMAEVPVFVPWHVAAHDSVVRWMPHSKPARVAAGALMATGGAALTAGAVWLATRGDLVSFVTDVAGSRLRGVAASTVQQLVGTLLGPSGMDTLQHGGLFGLGTIAAGFLLAATASGFGLRAIASAARRRS